MVSLGAARKAVRKENPYPWVRTCTNCGKVKGLSKRVVTKASKCPCCNKQTRTKTFKIQRDEKTPKKCERYP